MLKGCVKTSSPKSSPVLPPAALEQEGIGEYRVPRTPTSPALSSASTADGERSPEVPALPPPKLPDRIAELLRTPPTAGHFDTQDRSDPPEAFLGSPYPYHLRQESLSSEPEDDSPIHQLALHTPFLRPIPLLHESEHELQTSSLSAAAAVLANRARRPALGITEDWIRQHTAGDSDLERRHWLSDGVGDSDNSSLSDSLSGEDAAWLGEESALRTPRAKQHQTEREQPRRPSTRYPRKPSSSETLRQAILNRRSDRGLAKMATPEETSSPVEAPDAPAQLSPQEAEDQVHELAQATPLPTDEPELPSTTNLAGKQLPTDQAEAPNDEQIVPATPTRTSAKRIPATTPRLKKKMPWKGKNIMVLIPRDPDRGKVGHAPSPLGVATVNAMLKSWEQLGYNTRGFDLDTPSAFHTPSEYSQSRGAWPDFGDIDRERADRTFRVQLPDLNGKFLRIMNGSYVHATDPSSSAWKQYVDELQEAKLRALGVSFGNDDPPPPSISPASTMSRQPSVTHYPPLPFSPPIPASSASSNQAMPGFPFPAQYGGSGTQSPAIPGTASPVPFPGKLNPRASISISSPHGWSPQLLLQQQGMHRGGSPSLANFSSLMSPTSPFSPDGFVGHPTHQRHQSLQYPMIPHQFQMPARASPRLQDLREVDEDVPSKSPSKTPEPAPYVRHNASDSLQKEIDAAETLMEEGEYHLEEQMRSQFDNDQDYSPHDEAEQVAEQKTVPLGHLRETSVTFAPQPPRFGVATDAVTLHHPRPHSRGHSLSQKYFTEEDAGNGNAFNPQGSEAHVAEESEIETNPSNLGTPVQALSFTKLLHQRSFSTASNPWTDNESGKSASGRRPSHGSKPSLSGLNAGAPEFKFNPESTFTPGQFVFGGNPVQPIQPVVLNASLPSANSSQFSLPTTISSRINVSAPVFSPGRSEFSFSTSIRPDAAVFNPFQNTLSDSITTPTSGAESGSNMGSSIFGNINLSGSEFVKPAKKSKAIPIIRPSSQHSTYSDAEESGDGRPVADESRFKRARASVEPDDDVPRFADPSEEATPVPESRPVAIDEVPAEEEETVPSEEKSFEEDNMGPADTTFSSTMVSETTDSPAMTSPDPGAKPWTPFELKDQSDIASFNDARPPFGDDTFQRGHKKSLSATANAFVPGATIWKTYSPEPEVADTYAQGLEETLDNGTDVDEGDAMAVPDAAAEDDDEMPKEDADHSPIEEAVQEEEQIAAPLSLQTEELVAAPIAPSKGGLTNSRFAASPSTAASTPKGLSASRFAASSPPPPKKPVGLAGSRFAASPPPPIFDDEDEEVDDFVPPVEPEDTTQSFLPAPIDSLPPVSPEEDVGAIEVEDQSFADIDAIMRRLNENPSMGVNRALGSQPLVYHQPSPTRHLDLAAVTNPSSAHLPPQNLFRSDAPSPSPGRLRPLLATAQEFRPLHATAPEFHPQLATAPEPMLSTELEDPFVDHPLKTHSAEGRAPHNDNGSETVPESEDWEAAFSEDEHPKLESRVNFFDSHVNGVVGTVLDSRIAPLEHAMEDIKHLLASFTRRTPSSRRDRRSVSADIQHSDADDEDDDEMPLRRSMSPRRDKKMDQMRAVFLDVLAQQPLSAPAPVRAQSPAAPVDSSGILKALEEMKDQFAQSLHLDFRGEDLRNIVEDAVERRMPLTPKPATPAVNDEKADELHARILDLEQRLQASEARVENEVLTRRTAEDRAAEVTRQLESAETRIEVETMNKSVFGQRLVDLDDRLHQQEEKTREEIEGRRTAEDRLSEIQRLLRISSEEENRLRDVVEEREQKIKLLEATQSKSAMRLSLLEAGHANNQQTHNESQNRVGVLEADLREARKEARHFRSETDRLSDIARRQDGDLNRTRDENRTVHKLIDALGTQLEENERVRESWRSKFLTLQQEMAQAAREIAEETQRYAKREQTLMARQEVLDARLQAEARTRERIEAELERLENGERQGMRAVAESKRLETQLGELKTENHQLHQATLRYQAEFQEARESAAREVQRTRDSMQSEIDSANHQVNLAREELEDQTSRLRGQLDQFKLDADTAKARLEMLLEEAQTSKAGELETLAQKQLNELDDMQVRYERQLGNTTEDAQRTEQNLLERLSLSASKSEHLQDKVTHLEEKLQIAKEAALAAAQAAKSSTASQEPMPRPVAAAAAVPREVTAAAHPKPTVAQLPEKISPQALRESIMVLQEQLQEREQNIEELEAAMAKMDPDAETKISKRDDEIIWLRELLAVRHSDLQDIIAALNRDDYDKNRVKDAAIRLKANLQMEEQERERAMNGGSAINLPNIAASLREAATPRVAQAVGPLAAAWGSWRKTRDPGSTNSISSVLSSAQAAGSNSTPSRSSPGQNAFLGGLLTPPASGLRQTPPAESGSQPTAFSATGRRFTAQDLANRPKPMATRAIGNIPVRGSPSRSSSAPMTPPMMRPASYDTDAQVEDFDDAGFFDDD